MLKPGDNIDGWCGNCKLVLAHTIEAMVGDKPARVHCNTCRSEHRYRADKPGSAASGARSRQREGSPRANQYQKLLQGKDTSRAKRYSMSDNYSLGDVVQHPDFGLGVTTAIKDATKIEVVFENGVKTLIHGR